MGRSIGNFDWFVILPMVMLSGFSLALLGSMSPALFWQQSIFFLLGYGLFIFAIFIDYRILLTIWPILYVTVIVLLLLSFLGPEVRGTTRWLDFAGLRVQPSELVKPILLIAQAAYLSSQQKLRIRQIFTYLSLFVLPTFLVFKQPDLGNAIIYFGTTVGLLFVSPMPLRYFLSTSIGIGATLPFVWNILKDYQRQRVLAYLNPHLDATGAGYNAIQSIIAIGSGELFGRGLGRGPQSHLRFLPENHTDFIFASLSEELGFIGGSLVIGTYFFLLIQLFLIYRRSSSPFAHYLVLGMFLQLFFQITINIGMNVGILPITGITLPLISYGGSSIVATCFSLGLIQRISLDSNSRRRTIAIG